MSILDVWEKKATAFTRKTKEKTVCITETTRLKSLISGEEKNYRSLCAQVGRKYVEAHKDDADAEFPELMGLCRESLERMEGYKQQILQVKKLRTCPVCGENVPLDFAFCNFCGAKLPMVEIEPEPGFRKCTGCGAVIPDTMKFCRHCGAAQPVEEEAAPEPPTAEADSAADSVPDPEPATLSPEDVAEANLYFAEAQMAEVIPPMEEPVAIVPEASPAVTPEESPEEAPGEPVPEAGPGSPAESGDADEAPAPAEAPQDQPAVPAPEDAPAVPEPSAEEEALS